MPKAELSNEQILTMLKQVEAGRTAAELAREVGVSQHTIYACAKRNSAGWSRTTP